ncbi:MAG: TldD/PmbA family protein [Chloroflexi bacterium]|nr:TldD/PmbA family protein [Chloroflexota bacterium]
MSAAGRGAAPEAATPAVAPLEVARRVVEKARTAAGGHAGRFECDAMVVASRDSSVTVRLQKLETVKDAASRAVGLRVIVDGRQAVVSSADVSDEALDQIVADALGLAAISEPDEHAGLPDPADQATARDELQLYDEAVDAMEARERIDRALACEQAALDADRRIENSGGGSCSTRVAEVALADSNGFAGSYLGTSASLGVEVMAAEPDGRLRNDYWFSAERQLHRLEDAAVVGREAAARALRQLGARKAGTTTAPVVWEPRMAAGLLRTIANAADGEALYRRSTFLAGREGDAVASPLVSVGDDPRLPGRLGSRPFDGEGIATRRNVLFEDGVFQTFLCDTYNARRLGRVSTGSAVRDVGSLPGVGAGNLVMQAGDHSPEQIIAEVEDGLYLTSLMGFGINLTTGDFSRGAAGLWIRDGRLAEPVSEINVSGNLTEMLASIDAVGTDVQWFGSAAAPTLRMSKLTVSGS